MAFSLHLIVLLGLSSGLWMGANAGKKCNLKDCCMICPKGWAEVHGRCYMLHNQQLDWCDAEKHCTKEGGNLASFRKPDDVKHIREYIFRTSGTIKEGVWVGGNDAVKRGHWIWSDGLKFDFNGWAVQPQVVLNKSRCSAMTGVGHKLVTKEDCHTKRSFICATDLEYNV